MGLSSKGSNGRKPNNAILGALLRYTPFLPRSSPESSSSGRGGIPQLSSIANSVVSRCLTFLDISLEKLQQDYKDKYTAMVEEQPVYATKFLEYCCHEFLHKASKLPDYLGDQHLRRLIFDMMLALEAPITEDDSFANGSSSGNPQEAPNEDEGSVFYRSSTDLAVQVDEKKTAGFSSFKRIAPSCPEVADLITVHNLFDALTCSSGGRLHFLIFDKYLKCLDKVLKSAMSAMRSSLASRLTLVDGEYILAIDGDVPSQFVLQHIGISTWPGRLVLTTHALYFEYFQVGSGKKMVRYDLSTELSPVIKRGFTGPLGARLFDTAVMYKSASIPHEPIYFEFPELRGHSRRDYWLAISSEVLLVNRFVRAFNLEEVQRGEALSKAILGIFRYSAIKDALHIAPSDSKTILAFDLAEKVQKGDIILDALHNSLLLLNGNSLGQRGTESVNEKRVENSLVPFSLHTTSKLGFALCKRDPLEKDINFCEVCTHSTASLEKALDESLCFHKRTESARASVDQVKVEGIAANLALMKELLYPFIEVSKLMIFLSKWEDPSKSATFLVIALFFYIRGWYWFLIPMVLVFCALVMQYHKHFGEGRPLEPLEVPPSATKNPVERLLSLQDGFTQIEDFLQKGNIVLLKLRSLMHASVPKATDLAAAVLIAAAACLAFLPLKHLLMFIFVEAYTRNMPLRKLNGERLRRRYKEWWARVPAAPVRMVGQNEQKKKV